MAQKAYSLSHTKWMCKYHVVFTPKYRRKVIYNQIRSDLGEIFRRLCQYKGIEIIEGHLMPDHVHMLLAIPQKYSVSSVMGYLKGKSSLMVFDRHANMKYKFGNRTDDFFERLARRKWIPVSMLMEEPLQRFGRWWYLHEPSCCRA